MKLTAKTFAGLEDLLVEEIKQLGGKAVEGGRRVVEFEGDTECLYRILYLSRYAITVLRPIWRFTADDEHQAYRKAYSCDWSRYFDVDQSFAISPTVFSDIFTHSQYISLKMKDAICDRFRKSFHRRPNVDPQNPDIRLDLYVQGNQFIISLDAAGDPLFKRGYRSEGHRAPLNEVLAAGIIGLSGWDRKAPFYDGMCGTGTLCLEATLMARQIPSQLLRRKWSCMKWKDFDYPLWKQMAAKANALITGPLEAPIRGSDKMRSSIMAAQRSVNWLDIAEDCHFEKADFFQLKPSTDHGYLIMNPPYGERFEADVEQLYGQIGDRLKHHWKGFKAFLFTGSQEGIKSVGLKTSQKTPLFNGPIECRLVGYELW